VATYNIILPQILTAEPMFVGPIFERNWSPAGGKKKNLPSMDTEGLGGGSVVTGSSVVVG
jgi:hypothetical protein